MMTAAGMFIKVCPHWLRDPKYRRLQKMGVESPIETLLMAWEWAINEFGGPTVDLTDLEDACEWAGEEGALVTALQRTGFLRDDTFERWWDEGPQSLLDVREGWRREKSEQRARTKALLSTRTVAAGGVHPDNPQCPPGQTAVSIRTTPDVHPESGRMSTRSPGGSPVLREEEIEETEERRETLEHDMEPQTRTQVCMPVREAPESSVSPESTTDDSLCTETPSEGAEAMPRTGDSGGVSGHPEPAAKSRSLSSPEPEVSDRRGKQWRARKMMTMDELVGEVGAGTRPVMRERRQAAMAKADPGPPFVSSPAWEGDAAAWRALRGYCQAAADYYATTQDTPVTAQQVYDKHLRRLDTLAEESGVALQLQKVTLRLLAHDCEAGPNAAVPMLERYLAGGKDAPTKRELSRSWEDT